MAYTLDIYQSLWAMERRIPGQAEEPVSVHMERIAEAGYAGACVDPNVSEIPDCLALKPIFERLGLKCMVNAFPHDVEAMQPLLDMAAAMNATQVNVIGGVMPLNASEAVPVVESWLAMAEAYDFPLLLETHRNGTLNDLFFTLEVLELVPDLRLCADLSHFVVDRELQIPLNETDAGYFSTVLERSDSFQGAYLKQSANPNRD
jgi:sugar phosphate isomerase/epimerase